MNSSQFERWLKKQGIQVSPQNKTGHKDLYNPANNTRSTLPTHGGAKQLKTGTMEAIKKALRLQ
ncbi:type II toxin-antitoxin system HicA family toxin [Pararhodospirillum oryzae]|uniref:Type II toxin-antitoxin system HicA family toxin n=1 Tax=Pararhodospirillum oryzae TaxID=478448 RepID=A0A512HB25_9PROT|nr:type II toxin-antitoxin system HicA family toxin [Pararhodospirillum oryzae]GEO82638.1 hypothetical protein ROR02_27690 [Pararhodospirillum oryzae]